MKKSDFADFLNYLKNRPEEAARLRAVLGAAEQEAKLQDDARWLSAQEAGRLIGKSSRWVRANITLFESAKRVVRGNGYGWILRKGDVKSAYDVWLCQRQMGEVR